MKELKTRYLARIDMFEAKAKALNAKYARLSLLRLVSFFGGMAMLILIVKHFGFIVGLIVLPVFILAFAKFVKYHLAYKKSATHAEELVRINKDEIAFLENDLSPFQDGREFVDIHHLYSGDLDVFGEYSFFQYCNRTTTAIGKVKLAEWLSEPADIPEILKRQQAIRELKEKIDWRQDFQAKAKTTGSELEHLKKLKSWLSEPLLVAGNKILLLAFWLIPLWFVITVYVFIYYLPFQLLPVFLIPQAIILWQTHAKVMKIRTHTERMEGVLSRYAVLMRHIEQENFRSDKLMSLQKVFESNQLSGSRQLKRFSYYMEQLNVGMNPFALLLNIPALWDLRWVRKLEQWKIDHKDDLPNWFFALEQFDALVSFATVSFNRPDWHFPEMKDEPLFVAKGICHPLIPFDSCVKNDIEIPLRGHIKLLTGSNMAGKTTFLRTIGLNAVMAMAGLPVAATELKSPPIYVLTSMRTKDALHENTSSFMAELIRLKSIIDIVEMDKAMNAGEGFLPLVLLDEVLKGTNTNDRHKGAEALIWQLLANNSSGIVATHDLGLGSLEAKSDGKIENIRLDVRIKDGRLFFDYKLAKGVTKSFNASILMEQMGIGVEK